MTYFQFSFSSKILVNYVLHRRAFLEAQVFFFFLVNSLLDWRVNLHDFLYENQPKKKYEDNKTQIFNK
jgi:hypothetical protein